VLVCVCITVYFKGKGDQYAENRPNLIAVLGYLCLVAVLCVQIGNVMHALAATNTWLILAGLFGCWIYRRIVRGELGLAALAFISYLFMIGMTYYADLVFPHIYQRWGGGHPVPIAIEILAKGTNKVDDFKRAELIDQDSTGLFVQYSNLDIAVFVPKESIYRVCYLEKAQPHDLSLVLIPSLADDSKVTSFEGCSP
jgi:hypothetical protein